ncbi:MAG: YicC/YloC family endoribonuclease [Faecalibacterium sp.]
MILSMTGFGRMGAVLSGREITVELRSVNARYFEYSSRIPRNCNYMDHALKKTLGQKISRGKVELSLTIQTVGAAETVVVPNVALADSYRKALRDMGETLGVKNDVTVGMLSRFPEVLAVRQTETDEEQLMADVITVCEGALAKFIEMRASEGAKMKEDILSRLVRIEGYLAEIERFSEGRVEAYTARLAEKLNKILADQNIDEARILTEAAIFADKTAVDEETVRIHSHMAQYREILASAEPVGRKLDFLTQELNRETNTIGSKCQDLEMTRIVVEIKAEIEKIREQIQNIE